MAMHATRSVPGAMIGHPDPLIVALRTMRAQVHAMMSQPPSEYRRGYLAALRELAAMLKTPTETHVVPCPAAGLRQGRGQAMRTPSR